LAAILSRCSVDLLPARIDYRVQPTLRPRNGIAARLRLRDGSMPKATRITGTINALVQLLR